MRVCIDHIRQMASIIQSMEVLIDEKELAMEALNGLRPSYGTIITALDDIGDDDESFPFDKVCKFCRGSSRKARDTKSNTTDAVEIENAARSKSTQVPLTTFHLRDQSSSHMNKCYILLLKWVKNQRNQLLEEKKLPFPLSAMEYGRSASLEMS
eukprot:IDg1598t1